jgi:heme-degrading monooxygenase HmoA
MYARIVTITGTTDIDGGISWFRENVVPAIRDQKGYRGLGVNADRAGRVLGVLTLWDTEAERDASWDSLAAGRQESAAIIGGQLTAETYEELLRDAGKTPPAPGSALILQPISMEPAKVDENFAFFKNEVVPRIKASQGFQNVRALMNRETGHGLVGTVWADEDAMRAAAADAQARRPQAVARGVQFGEASFREIVFVDF